MDKSFQDQDFNNFSPNTSENDLLDDDFDPHMVPPLPEHNKFVLSTGQESIQLDKEELDDTVLKNIMYCYSFLDTDDREFVNSAEAEQYIRQVKDQNPQLFELLFDVLQVVSEDSSKDTNIAKNLFITRLRDYIYNLRPGDESSVRSLRTPRNAISDYYRNLWAEKNNLSARNYPVPPCNEEEFLEERNESRDSLVNLDFDQVQEHNANKFESFEEYMTSLGPNRKVNEYVVFNYNRDFKWEETLRSLS